MCSHNPLQTTADSIAEVLTRDALQRAGQSSPIISQRIIHQGEPGSGICRYGAEFTYADGTIETSWGV